MLDNCTDKCESDDNLKCLLKCGNLFKELYHQNINNLIEQNLNRFN
jgi:hypothetical protein